MNPRQGVRKGMLSAQARPGESVVQAPSDTGLTTAGEPGAQRVRRDPGSSAFAAALAKGGPRKRAWRPRPGSGSTIGRLVLAGALLGPGLGMALGPWIARNHLPLYEAHAAWRGPAPERPDWPRPARPGESARAMKIGERTVLVARGPTAAGAEALAIELALPRLSRSPELASARDGHRESWAASLLRG